MTADGISIQRIGQDRNLIVETWPTCNFEYTEELLYHILDTFGVKPKFRMIFGLKSISNPSIWIAPNIKLNDPSMLPHLNTKQKKPELELRVRFRVTNLRYLMSFDEITFDLLLRQIRYDFLYTRFTDEKRDLILLKDAVLGLIAAEMAIYAKEKNIMYSELFNQVKPKKFAPRKSSYWQRWLLSYFIDELNIRKSVEECMNDNLTSLKPAYLEKFFQEVCPNYGSEVYQVYSIDNLTTPQPLDLQLRFSETEEDSSCIVEHRSSLKRDLPMTELCDIHTISYGTLRGRTVEINRLKDKPFRIRFESDLESKSFLSLIEGYYRLMRKWHFNFCRDVVSPELQYLRTIRCHGPIGQESSRSKLLKNFGIGTFLIRMCERTNNRYIIDVIISCGEFLSIGFKFNPFKRKYETDLRTNAQLVLNQDEYSSLHSLVNDIQIKIGEQRSRQQLMQLKNWLFPGEYDDYPMLMISVPKRKVIQLINGMENSIKSVAHLPNIIPTNLLKFSVNELPYSNNMIKGRIASLNSEKDVVVKGLYQANGFLQGFRFTDRYSIIISGQPKQDPVLESLSIPQLRFYDWLFIESPLFAKTFGLCLEGYQLIQEYFHYGQLDRYLIKDEKVTEAVRRSIAYQLTHALLFLQEQQIVHGKIRCHNIFIKHLYPMQIKIADPLGTFDFYNDRAFIPNEIFSLNGGRLFIDQYTSSIDIWATGTTLWQVYNRGARPISGLPANELTQPSGCSDQVWRVIETCWILDRGNRASPQSLFRDISDTIAWEREDHNYDYIVSMNDCYDDANHYFDSYSTPTSSTIKETCNLDREVESRGSTHSGGSQTNLVISANQKTNEASKIRRRKKFWIKYILSQETTPTRSTNDTTSYVPMTTNRSNSTNSLSSTSDETGTTTLTIDQNTRWQIDSTKLKLGCEIGRGTSGIVYKGILKGSRFDTMVAVKQIKSDCMYAANDLKKEFSILKDLDHENIVRTYGFVDEVNIMLVVEFMPLGSLLPYIKNSSREHLMTMPLKKYALDIARGMEYLESMKIVHRDLALRNILLKNQNQAKIGDFGLAHTLVNSDHYKRKSDRALPIRWCAPEALQTWAFTHKTDVWSYGIVLWEMYSGGSSPQYSGPLTDLYETLKRERLLKPEDCPDVMYRLMLSCWAFEPENRDTFSKICDHLENLQDSSLS